MVLPVSLLVVTCECELISYKLQPVIPYMSINQTNTSLLDTPINRHMCPVKIYLLINRLVRKLVMCFLRARGNKKDMKDRAHVHDSVSGPVLIHANAIMDRARLSCLTVARARNHT